MNERITSQSACMATDASSDMNEVLEMCGLEPLPPHAGEVLSFSAEWVTRGREFAIDCSTPQFAAHMEVLTKIDCFTTDSYVRPTPIPHDNKWLSSAAETASKTTPPGFSALSSAWTLKGSPSKALVLNSAKEVVTRQPVLDALLAIVQCLAQDPTVAADVL